MNLNLNKSIAFFDLETTGINVASDRIVEIAILKVSPDQEKSTYTKRINPTISIPESSSAIHGIYDVDVANAPTFEEIANEIIDFIGDSDLAGYNSNRFDVPVLVEEFLRVDIDFDMNSRKMIDVQTIFYKMEQRTLTAAYKFYCEKELENAHSADADTNATYEVLKAQLARYEEVTNDMDFLSEFTNFNPNNVDFAGRIVLNDKEVETFNFGKYRGKSVQEVLKKDPGYYGWMMNGDFPLYTKQKLKEIKQRM